MDIDEDDTHCQCRHPCTSDSDCLGTDEVCDINPLLGTGKCHTCTSDHKQIPCSSYIDGHISSRGDDVCEEACGADQMCDEKDSTHSWCESNRRIDCSGCVETVIEDCGSDFCWDDGLGTSQCVELCDPGDESCWIECVASYVGLVIDVGGSTCTCTENAGNYEWDCV
jgi:hypothetical protein